MANKRGKMDFDALVDAIQRAHEHLSAQAGKAVNISLTLRNWMIGFYIEEYERAGLDRAKYGERLMDELASALQVQGVARCDRRELYRYRQFYLAYPQIVDAAPPQLLPGSPLGSINKSLPDKSGKNAS